MISVIIPFFNVEDYLEECLLSVINQTYKDIEILCVNDCTIDNSVNIIKKYMMYDSRIRLINHEFNKGLGGARNTGIQEARGEYISFVDGDDFLDSTMLEKMFSAVQENNTDAAVCGINLFFNDESIPVSGFHPPDTQSSRLCRMDGHKDNLLNMWPCAGNKLYKTSIIREHNIHYQEKMLYEDHFLFFMYFSKISSFYYIGEPLYWYRKDRPGSITSHVTGREHEVLTALEYLESVFRSAFSPDTWKANYARLSFRLVWERSVLLWPHLKDWKVFANEVESWLFKRFPKDLLEASVDSYIDKMDPMYRYLFSSQKQKEMFRFKLLLKENKFIDSFYNNFIRQLTDR